VKGIGESATIGSIPAVANAVLDALSPFGIDEMDIPCTPEKVWRALQAANPPPRPSPARPGSTDFRRGDMSPKK